ncbi:thiol reductant ABC exporter subunit CydC [Amycolatopsis suaedae]|uniref:Thiol reductant ABC exporter subunit CydC n=1 Tax=Amycolatopsis suaedae TaxID=2510978 RepID=A0A4Q7JE78_9PSEU|nr:thiol reductant ABC exporter subunit CydC [Amycolatopsis suaedae]RZQ65578.1 thiol reductant ABC exporter subunit CydC [Amycolatopsis suaedae]
MSRWGLSRADAVRLARAALLAVAAELAGTALLATAAWLLLRAAERPPMAALTVAIVAVRTLALLRGSLRYAERLAGHDVVLSAVGRLRERVYRALLPHRDRRARDADLLARVVSDVDAAQDAVLRCLLPAVVAGLTGVIAVAVALLVAPAVAGVLALGLLVAGVALPYGCARASAAAACRAAPIRAALGERTVDLVRGAAELSAYGATGVALAAAEADARALARAERTGAVVALSAAGTLVQWATVVAACLLAAPSGGPVAAAVALGTLGVFEAVLPLTAAAQRWVAVGGSLRRLRDLLDAPAPVAGTRPVPEGPLCLRAERLTGRPGLSTVDLELPQGSRVALLGPNGSGKTTLLDCMAGLVAPASGRVTLDGRDLAEYTGLPEVITTTATAHVFRGSVRDNLLLTSPSAGAEELRAACRAADLDVDLDQDALTLSGGQRQRLVLARAVLARPRVLLLDEPAEGLDAGHGERVLAGVLRACPDVTVVLATHTEPPADFTKVFLRNNVPS